MFAQLVSSISVLTTLSALLSQTYAAGTDGWRSRSIYQVMTDRFALPNGSTDKKCDTADNAYCGGTWQGVIQHLDYIQGMGFDAIYISPITENFDQTTKEGQGYHGYWPSNLYEVNKKFGSPDDLRDLSKALHDRGMWLMLDAAINDMGYPLNGGDFDEIDYSVFTPFNDKKYFHPYCPIKNFDNFTEAQHCWLGDDVVALPDLNTDSKDVVNMMGDWIKEVVSNYSVDGLRLDAAKHTNNAFLSSFAQDAGVFTIGEVYDGDAPTFCPYQSLLPSMTNYPNYFAAIKAFTAGNISALSTQMALTSDQCADTTSLASFSENHDLPRFASYTKDANLAKSMLAWTILSDGVPMIYQGQEQGFSGNGTPSNREALWTSKYNTNAELYKFTKLMNRIRRQAIDTDSGYLTYKSWAIYSDDSNIVLRKGNEGSQIVTVLSNSGSKQKPYNLMLATAFTSGEIVTDVVSCKNYTVTETGQLNVDMHQGVPHVFFPTAKMNGSELCGIVNFKDPKKVTGSASLLGGNALQSSAIAMVFATIVAFALL